MKQSLRLVMGFTLVELMVVIVVVSILTLLAYSTYSGARSKGNDARKKLDIDNISKTFEESAFDQSTGLYRAVIDSDFVSGKVPAPPEGGNYTFVYGPNSTYGTPTPAPANNYEVCALLGSGGSCNKPAANCYCKSALQSIVATPTP